MSKDYERKIQTSETLIQVAMIRLLLARLGRKNEPVPKHPLGRKQFPMAFGDDFDCSVDHFDASGCEQQFHDSSPCRFNGS